jgi:DNA repair exonuclease SbcCD ATPase subunit
VVSLAQLPELVGFFSYSREDDEDFRGSLSALRDAIQRELSAQLGRTRRNFRLWQDQEAIAPGKDWKAEIEKAVEQSVFFIPIVTPRAVGSDYCQFEFASFVARESALGRGDLVFPILWISVPALVDEAEWRVDPVLSVVTKRQYVNWRPFRYAAVDSPGFGQAIELFCGKIVETLREPCLSPEERRRLEAEAKMRAEDQERARQEAEAKRQAEERKRRREEALAKKWAEREAREREQAEAKRRAEEEECVRQEAEAERRAAEEEERIRQEAEAKRQAEEREKLRREAQAKQRAEEEAREREQAEAMQAEEEESQRLEALTKQRAEDEARERERAEVKKRAEEAERLRQQAEAKRHAEEQERLRTETLAKQRAEEEAREREQAEAKRRAEEQEGLRKEALAKKQASANVTPLTAAQERALKAGDSFKEDTDCPEMIVVPAGRFLMGSPQGQGFSDHGFVRRFLGSSPRRSRQGQ